MTALFEDARGTIWCGGERGVAEFDGGSWRPARFGAEIPAAAVTALAQDGEGRVWVGTRAGAGYSDGYEWHWFTASSGLPADEVLALAADRNGSIWIGTTRGLARFDTTWSVPGRRPSERDRPRGPRCCAAATARSIVGAEQGFLVAARARHETVGSREGLEGPRTLFLPKTRRVNSGSGPTAASRGTTARYANSTFPPVQTVQVEREAGVPWRPKNRCLRPLPRTHHAAVTALAADAEGGVWVGTPGG